METRFDLNEEVYLKGTVIEVVMNNKYDEPIYLIDFPRWVSPVEVKESELYSLTYRDGSITNDVTINSQSNISE